MPDKHKVKKGHHGDGSAASTTHRDHETRERKHNPFGVLFHKKKHKAKDKRGGHEDTPETLTSSRHNIEFKLFPPKARTNGGVQTVNKSEMCVEDPKKVSAKVDLDAADLFAKVKPKPETGGTGVSLDSSHECIVIRESKSANNSPKMQRKNDIRGDMFVSNKLKVSTKTQRSHSIGNISDPLENRRDSGAELIAEFRKVKYNTLPGDRISSDIPDENPQSSQQEWKGEEDIARILQLRENNLRRLAQTSENIAPESQKVQSTSKQSRLRYVFGKCCPCLIYV